MAKKRQLNPMIHEAFNRVGNIVEGGGDRPFLISGDQNWWVLEGSVDVFTVAVEDGEPVGNRDHLFRVDKGQLMVGMSTSQFPFGLLAVGTRGSRLAQVNQRQLEDLFVGPQAADLYPLLDEWVAHLYEGVTKDLPPEECTTLDAGEFRARKKMRVCPADEVLWTHHLKGSSILLDNPHYEVKGDDPLPLGPGVWLNMPKASVVLSETTEELADRNDLWPSLERFHGLYLGVVNEAAQQADLEDRRRMKRRAEANRRTLSNACEQVAKTLNARHVHEIDVNILQDAQSDPLLMACQRVGHRLNVQVEAPAASEGDGELADPLGAIARSSKFRTRQVILRDSWWTRDAGPLLGYRNDEDDEDVKYPVALLPKGKGFVIDDPSTGTVTPVDETVAETIDPMAFSFYRPFPNEKIGMKDILRFAVQGSKRDLWVIFLVGLASGLLGLVTPMATGEIFNNIIPGAARQELLQITLVLVALAVANTMFRVTGTLALVRMEGRSSANVQGAVWDRLLGLPMTFFRPFTSGNLASRAMSIETIRQVLSNQVIQTFLVAFFSSFHFGLMFWYSKELAWWAIGLILLAVAVTAAIGQWQVVAERSVAKVRNRLAGTVLQFLSSVGKLRVAGAEVQAFAVWAQGFSKQRHHQFQVRARANYLSAFNVGYPVISTLVIYALAAPLLTETMVLGTGDFLAFMTSFTICLSSMLSATGAFNTVARIVPMFEQAQPILESLPEVETASADPGRLRGEIDVHRLNFRYQDDGAMVIRDLTLSIGIGEFVALVGPSGSGKSTLLRLLLGFETPHSGAVSYDGQDLDSLDSRAVRNQIGVVLQNGRMMSGDIFTNIVGSSRATMDDAWEAAAMAGLDTDIKAMPMGMHTVINEGGGTLSGGQRQRLMIARALVKKPKILFFDEATSALDNRTQEIVTQSLDRLQATRIVIAHRLSTIQNADRIFVLEGGQMVESGSFEELMQNDGTFRELAERQMA